MLFFSINLLLCFLLSLVGDYYTGAQAQVVSGSSPIVVGNPGGEVVTGSAPIVVGIAALGGSDSSNSLPTPPTPAPPPSPVDPPPVETPPPPPPPPVEPTPTTEVTTQTNSSPPPPTPPPTTPTKAPAIVPPPAATPATTSLTAEPTSSVIPLDSDGVVKVPSKISPTENSTTIEGNNIADSALDSSKKTSNLLRSPAMIVLLSLCAVLLTASFIMGIKFLIVIIRRRREKQKLLNRASTVNASNITAPTILEKGHHILEDDDDDEGSPLPPPPRKTRLSTIPPSSAPFLPNPAAPARTPLMVKSNPPPQQPLQSRSTKIKKRSPSRTGSLTRRPSMRTATSKQALSREVISPRAVRPVSRSLLVDNSRLPKPPRLDQSMLEEWEGELGRRNKY